MADVNKVIPKIVETQEDRVPEEVTPGAIFLERDTGRMSFDASDGERHQVKDPTKLPLTGGTLEGDVNLGTHKVSKDYVEGSVETVDNSTLLNKGEVNEMINQTAVVWEVQ